MLGICDHRVCERLLGLHDFSCRQVVDIIKSLEQTQLQVKQMSGGRHDGSRSEEIWSRGSN